MKILVVDDEDKLRDVIVEYCHNENYITDTAENGVVALDKLKSNQYDILILDIMMPEKDGFSVLQELPKEKRIPCIILSARSEEYDKLQGFDLGIDDYVTKPFSPKELIARIKALAKRLNISDNDKYILDTLEIDYKGHTLKIDNERIEVTPKEFEILTYLIKNKNIAISREQLLSTIWGYDFFGDDRTVDTHIKMLRNNLGKYRDHIETVRSLGYKFVDEK